MTTLSPARLVSTHVDELLNQLTGVFDGDSESIHHARIATRRLREALHVIDDADVRRVTDTVRIAGRELGRVRELDVLVNVLDSLGDRIPTAAATELHAVRQVLRERALAARRRMVKRLEKLDLPALRDALPSADASRLRTWLSRTPRLTSPKWVEPIWARLLERSAASVKASERTPAVYFPNRTHRSRVAVKKLRYAVEVAADTDVWRPRRILKDLRRIQNILGHVHDAQVLIDVVNESAPGDQPVSAGRTTLIQLLNADITTQYAEYVRQRDRLVHIAEACKKAAARGPWRAARPLVAASVLVTPMLIESVRSRRSESTATLTRDEAVTPPLHRRGA